MKKVFCYLIIFSCFTAIAYGNPRRLIVLMDWKKERITTDLKNPTFNPAKHGFGPPTANLVTALAQKTAPIVVTSSIWHNFVARRKLFHDFLQGKGTEYKNKYERFKTDEVIAQFQARVQAYFQQNGQKIIGNFGSRVRKELDTWFLCYVTPFNNDEWILKKASDYIYVLIPKVYLTQLKSKPLPETERNFNITLSENDLYLGLKIDSMATLPYEDALDPNKHKLSIDRRNYAQLLKKKDARTFSTLSGRGIVPPEPAVVSKHCIKVLSELFVTKWNLQDKNKNTEKTEINRALYLYPWHIYLNGHGSPSISGPIQEINVGGRSVRIQFAYLAGIELNAFRELLSFLNTSIQTEFFFYESCYSGGQHLQKVYEHQWDYSSGRTKKVETRQDVFNYMIVAGNLVYSVTWTNMPVIYPPFKKVNLNAVRIDYGIYLTPFFNGLEKYFAVDHIAVAQKKSFFDTYNKLQQQEAKKRSMIGRRIRARDWQQVTTAIRNLKNQLATMKFITLTYVVQNIHNVLRHQPAVRYPGSDFFVALPIKEEEQVAARIRFETSTQTEQRKKEASRVEQIIKEQAEQHIQKQKEQPLQPPRETNLIQPLEILRQKLMQLQRTFL